MESMSEIRGRITSIEKTMKITNAMYLMASSKLKRARSDLAATEPYFKNLQYVITEVMDHTETGRQRYFATDRDIPPEERKVGYLIMTSDKGLAGSYNLNVCRLAEDMMRKTAHNRLYFSGLTGRNYFLKRPELGEADLDNSYPAVQPDVWRARQIAETLLDAFLSNQLDQVFIIYTDMKNALVSEAEAIQILPLTPNMFPVSLPKENSGPYTYQTEYYPSALEVLDRMVPNYLKGVIYSTMVVAFAAEQNARMTAMKSATDNAGEIISTLSLKYNQVRQSAITTEINEVVAGANAQEQ